MYIHVHRHYMPLRSNILFNWPFSKMGILFIIVNYQQINAIHCMTTTAFHISVIFAEIHEQHGHRSIDTPVTEQPTIIICIIFIQWSSAMITKSRTIFTLVSLRPVNEKR